MDHVSEAREGMVIGQRVKARFDHGRIHVGVISGAASVYRPEPGRTVVSYPVQFEPCGAHFQCHYVSAYGDASGWTDQEYRVEREKAYCGERAATVERERRERYPDAVFSMLDNARGFER